MGLKLFKMYCSGNKLTEMFIFLKLACLSQSTCIESTLVLTCVCDSWEGALSRGSTRDLGPGLAWLTLGGPGRLWVSVR